MKHIILLTHSREYPLIHTITTQYFTVSEGTVLSKEKGIELCLFLPFISSSAQRSWQFLCSFMPTYFKIVSLKVLTWWSDCT